VALIWKRGAAIAGERFLQRRAPCVNWVDPPTASTSTLLGEPLLNYYGVRKNSVM
jgi:hypothetical protein